MAKFNPQNVVQELERSDGTLTQILPMDEFAESGMLADQLAQKYRNLKPTQLRKFFHTLKGIERGFEGEENDPLENKHRTKIYPLLPDLAYACGRDLIPQEFYDLMRVCMSTKKLQTIGDFKRLVQFLTAILAYHKFREKVKGGRQ